MHKLIVAWAKHAKTTAAQESVRPAIHNSITRMTADDEPEWNFMWGTMPPSVDGIPEDHHYRLISLQSTEGLSEPQAQKEKYLSTDPPEGLIDFLYSAAHPNVKRGAQLFADSNAFAKCGVVIQKDSFEPIPEDSNLSPLPDKFVHIPGILFYDKMAAYIVRLWVWYIVFGIAMAALLKTRHAGECIQEREPGTSCPGTRICRRFDVNTAIEEASSSSGRGG